MALGSFYPFSRNHNSKGSPNQEPYRWDSVKKITQITLGARYSLLPYYNTLFFLASQTGGTVARPLFFEFSDDSTTWTIEHQFLIGPWILISPVVDQGATKVQAYFPPKSNWYNFWNYAPAPSGSQNLDAPISTIPVHIRGGGIIPRQIPRMTISDTRKSPFEIVVALDTNFHASGDLFLDDGESLKVGTNCLTATFSCSMNTSKVISLSSSPSVLGTLDPVTMSSFAQNVSFLGIPNSPKSVFLNGAEYSNWKFDSTGSWLNILGLNLLLSKPFTIEVNEQ